MSRSTAAVAILFAPVLLFGGRAAADEVKTPVSASMILNIVAAPVQSRASAFDEALRSPGPSTPDSGFGEVLPDGSVRYGNATVIVRNPCPPGAGHYEPPVPLLPSRRLR